ncbi:MAG: prolyl oligopeptidase family serine peptidase [Saprospiraceae bacterium]|nr:prolyl oligopeptidase family serine peptidase [Saprospiraceae bacterium]
MRITQINDLKWKNYFSYLIYCFLFSMSSIHAQVPNQSSLSIEQIMQGEAFVGYSPKNIQWSENGQYIYFQWRLPSDEEDQWYQIDINSRDYKPRPLSEEEQDKKRIPSGEYTQDYQQKVYEKDGDIYLLNLVTQKSIQVTQTMDREQNPKFSADEKLITYTKNSNLYSWDSTTGQLKQWTNFKKGNPRNKIATSTEIEEWLKDDQMALFEIIQQQATEKERKKSKNKHSQNKHPKVFYLGDRTVRNLQLDPSARYITFSLVTTPKAKRTKVPAFVTENGYLKDLKARAKVGSPQSRHQLAIYDTERDTVYFLQAEMIPGIYKKPAFLQEYHDKASGKYEKNYSQPRAVIAHGPYFSKKGYTVVDVKAQDGKDRWIMRLDLASGEVMPLDKQHNDAWIGGPGISGWKWVGGDMGWMKDEEHIWFHSEESGFSHLYTVNVRTNKKKALTSGEFEVTKAFLSRDKQHFYLTTSEVDLGERHFYKMDAEGGTRTQITTLEGNNRVSLSPDEKNLAILYSSYNQPWDLYLMANKAQSSHRRLTKSTTTDFEKYTWRVPELVYFEAADGAKVRARLYQPKKVKKNAPAVVFVHGAGYLQNVHKWWSSYYREYMFHNLLVDNGYTVLDIDYRASAGYGRDWRTATYRHMGGKDLSDQVDGARFLVDNYNIDPKRIGIYGGSYGGFITLMAMFNEPEVFKCGAALRSVTDWAHYNHPYTSNILNTPVEDSIAYKRSSPIYFAEGLKGRLLILHGMVDTNVQFQDVVRLSQRLIELGKENWELAVFPVEGHGFRQKESWTDEYKRIFKMFQEELK